MATPTEKKLRIAVIGLGKMGLLHASILSAMPNVEIVALCDRSFIISTFVKKVFRRAQVVNDVEKLTDLDVDSIYITTPIPVHFPVISALYSKGIARNLFVEKTLASSWDESKELCDLARSRGGVNMVGYMKRFAVTFAKAKNLLSDGVLGKPVSFNAYAYSSDFSPIQQGSKTSTLRGGVLSDLGSHVIDLALWFFGDFKVDSAVLESIIDRTYEDSARFEIQKSDLRGHVDVSWCMDNYRMPAFGLTIRGDEGVMKVNGDVLELELNSGTSSKWFKHDLNDNVNFLLGDPEYYREDERFIKSLRNICVAEPSFETASKVDYIIDQVKKVASISDQSR